MFCNAFILRTFPYSNSSLILKIFSEKHGILSVLAKGAKRLKSPFTAVLQILSEVNLDVALSSHSELHTLKTAEILYPEQNQHILTALTKNYALFSVVSQDARWIESRLTLSPADSEIKTRNELSENVPINSSYQPLYKLFKEYLTSAPLQNNPGFASLIFKTHFLILTGTFPQNTTLRIPEATNREILDILKLPWEKLPTIVPSQPTLIFLRNIIERDRKTQ